MSFGVAVIEIVPLAGSMVSCEPLSIMDLIDFSMLPHSSISAELAKVSDELPPPPESVDEPPTLTDRVGLVGRL